MKFALAVAAAGVLAIAAPARAYDRTDFDHDLAMYSVTACRVLRGGGNYQQAIEAAYPHVRLIFNQLNPAYQRKLAGILTDDVKRMCPKATLAGSRRQEARERYGSARRADVRDDPFEF